MATTYLTDTQGTPTDNLKWTWSTWLKRGELARGGTVGIEYIFTTYVDASNYFNIGFSSSDQLDIYNYVSGSDSGRLVTTRVFSDIGAWYNVVVVYDSANGAAGDRMKLYINGVEETVFSTDTNPSSSQACIMNADTRVVELGRRSDASTNFSGILVHTHFADGQAYAPTVFGEVDSTSGIWIPKIGPSVTYGNNGFFLKYGSGALGTDSSGKSNDFVVSGTMTTTKDNPENNFSVMNLLDNWRAGSVFTNGNNTVTTHSGNSTFNTATVPVQAGKWYVEMKCGTPFVTYTHLGIGDKVSTSTSDAPGDSSEEYTYLAYNGNQVSDGSASAYGDSYTTGDIIGVYIDLDNLKLYFGKNGTVQNSGTGITIAALTDARNGWYSIIFGDEDGGGSTTGQFNFGNGYFGTTAVTSGVADAGGEGTFEYDPSAGTFDSASKDFRAICTNNIATYGG